ncbi:AIPR family protein [Marinoscillum pacificum]|uniref:AIPR family protein n=1 Tax=Marinoscillum pacificum TaxID=392723 RepID=UPI0021583213|nr:AIPR family protein [Marinoscillum pacificum]
MAKNDKILIDGIIDDRVDLKIPSNKRDEAFEYFSFEQTLKDYDLSTDEIKYGSVDGRNDGGIDGFYIIVNGHLLSDPQSFKWPRSGSVLEVWIITCKHHDTFKQAPLDNLAASMVEILDFTIDSPNLKGDYSEQVIKFRENLKLAYRKVSPRLSQFSINFCYASRGSTEELGDSIVSRSKQITQIAKDSFGNCSSEFLFHGASELIELHRKSPNFSLELPFKEDLSSGERYIVLVDLEDYYNFISDSGKLRRYLFDSNVRDFMGLNRVNEDIRETLLDSDSPDFWLLNNGVTILATGASVIGKSIQIQDIQIVNGLQTSESIFRHFQNGGNDPKNRSVLVKVIVSSNEKVRDTIIRATNNQTTVELASLHATDKIQRDIEDVLKRNDLYYERRTNFYKNQGLSSDLLITPLYIASGFVNLILKSADQASRLKSRFMRSESSYEKVFSQTTDLNVWPKIAFILKSTDSFLETVRPVGARGGERFLKSKRQFLSFLTISRLLETFNFSIADVVQFDLNKYTNDELRFSWDLMESLNSESDYRPKMQKSYLNKLCIKASEEWKTRDVKRIVKGKQVDVKYKKIKKAKLKEGKKVTMEFAMQVHMVLPPQPWKPGVDREIMDKLNCTRSEYFDAVKLLIDEGLRNEQKNGVVYDMEGNVISFDPERVDEETLKLKS